MYESLDDEEVHLSRFARYIHVSTRGFCSSMLMKIDEDIAKCGRARVMPSEQPISGNGISIDIAIVALADVEEILLDAHTRLYYLHLPYANYALDDS